MLSTYFFFKSVAKKDIFCIFVGESLYMNLTTIKLMKRNYTLFGSKMKCFSFLFLFFLSFWPVGTLVAKGTPGSVFTDGYSR